jgi:hypothetical protein
MTDPEFSSQHQKKKKKREIVDALFILYPLPCEDSAHKPG